PAYDKALQTVTVADGTGIASRGQEIAAALVGGGFTKAAHFLAAAVPKTVVYYGAGYADVAPDVANLLGIPASQVEPSNGIVGVQVYIGSDFDSGTKYGVASVPADVVKQTAGDVKCQAVNPALVAR
ncbi:LytR C-terminal domain-containing protein, partial [Arthrobacter sp. Hiyo1]